MRRRRRLGRTLVFAGICLWIPELYIAWGLFKALTTPVRGPNGQFWQFHVHLNASAWVVAVGWTVVVWLMIGFGIWDLRKTN